MNAFTKILTDLPASTAAAQTADAILAARAAAGILEWLELTTPRQAAELSVASFDAIVSEGQGAAHIHLYGVSAIDKELKTALRLWCGQVLRSLGALSGTDPLITFLQSFSSGARDRFHAIAMTTAKLGAGSWIDPTAPAQRVTSHFYEIDMFGILGRGDSPTAATDSWRRAALADLPSREHARQGVAA